MGKRLKVFGGLTMGLRPSVARQQRTIVATHSQKEAARLVGITLHEFRGYWCETGNATELSVALARPGVVFVASDSMSKDFVAVCEELVG